MKYSHIYIKWVLLYITTCLNKVKEENVSTQYIKNLFIIFQTFQLNWDKIECTKCINIPAIKYTELGPFCACWTLRSPEGVTPSTLEVCVRVSHSEIQGQLEQDSSCAPIEIDVRVILCFHTFLYLEIFVSFLSSYLNFKRLSYDSIIYKLYLSKVYYYLLLFPS